MEIKGIVDKISQKQKSYAIKIDEVWYSNFGTSPVDQGDEVKLTYEVNGDFKNIKNIEITNAVDEPVKPEVIKPQLFGKEKVMRRMNALNNATALLTLIGSPTEDLKEGVGLVTDIADKFLDYLNQ